MRMRSVAIFAVIAMLLAAKLGIDLWQPTSTTEAAHFTIEEEVASEPPLKARHNIAASSSEETLASIERYLVPDADAAVAAEASATLPYEEDPTLTSLRQYKQDLEDRARNLDAREKAITEAEDRVRRRITELEQLEASIQQRLNDEQKIKSKKVKRLTAVFEGMKPDKAAPVVAKMELETVIKVFLLMDEKKVGKILSFLPPEKAVIISQALTRQISTVK